MNIRSESINIGLSIAGFRKEGATLVVPDGKTYRYVKTGPDEITVLSTKKLGTDSGESDSDDFVLAPGGYVADGVTRVATASGEDLEVADGILTGNGTRFFDGIVAGDRELEAKLNSLSADERRALVARLEISYLEQNNQYRRVVDFFTNSQSSDAGLPQHSNVKNLLSITGKLMLLVRILAVRHPDLERSGFFVDVLKTVTDHYSKLVELDAILTQALSKTQRVLSRSSDAL